MNREEYNKLFHKVGLNRVAFKAVNDCDEEILVLVNEAIKAEREACARVCDEKVAAEYATGKVDHNEMDWTQACAIAIRARGQE
jgi:hypothetical protein